ncbi:tetratricopeptide repeat protein [Gracilimonas mengyeensis]|uniref:Tetratricopeptide repeat-containing protein n=1 Tax=Gracilimonas mengyeensis TaxID=1302730 RepID=A0A521E7P1_9BACT|nr:tetratricopeptide repeat protein [Gracilimonas mengyeensis]SMO79190.1 Tetratricopeptide repeat-containing protein [Gracilimonas mengyeensis]
MKTLSYFFVFLMMIFAPGNLLAQDSTATERDQFLELKQELNTAIDASNRQEVARIGYAMEPFFDHSDLKKYARYYAGYAWYRMYNLPAEDGSEPDEKFLDRSINHLEKAVDIDPDFAEAYALLGSTFGMKATGMFSGMRYGPKSQSATDKAKELSPENPRVYMIEGTGNIYKPSMFGGGLDNAMTSLQKAAELFRTFEPQNELAPDWGHAEVYAWIGQVYAKQENYQQAKEAYEQALQVDSDYGWVKYQLLPSVQQQLNE